MIEGEINGKKCRFINGCGPQEYSDNDTRMKCFARIEEEVIIAKNARSTYLNRDGC